MSFVSPEQIREALHLLGVRAGDSVLVHSDAIIAAQLPPMPDEKRLDCVIEAIESVIGPQGTLIMPTFTYSFTRGEVFDLSNSPSTVGMLTERFRTRSGVCRTHDPIFSFAARGPVAQSLSETPINECFGRNSAFAKLHELNCWILCLGCSLTSGGTFMHYVEKSRGVDYRYDKRFEGTIIAPDRSQYSSSVVYYVRDLSRDSGASFARLQQRLEEKKLLHNAVLGRSRLLAMRAADLFNTAWQMLDEDPQSLIAEGCAASMGCR